MADLKINPEEIQGALANFVKSYDPGVAARDEVGTVTQAGDGIARIEGLPSTMANELLRFENGTLGLALNLDVREIGTVFWVAQQELKKEHQFVVQVRFSLYQSAMVS